MPDELPIPLQDAVLEGERLSRSWTHYIDDLNRQAANALPLNGGLALPTSSAGLPSGTLWNNGGVVSVVP